MIITITHENEGRRLDKFLFGYLNNAPHSFVYKLLRKKRIKLNGSRAYGNELLREGDELRLFLSKETIASCRKARLFEPATPLTDIIYEDEHLLVVNKPAGLPSQGGMDSSDHLLARVQYYLQESGAYDPQADFTPALCNRLDVNTSGLVICGKTLHALQAINALFAGRGMDKEYLTVVHGTVGREGESATLEGVYEKDSASNIARISPRPAGPHETAAITSYTVSAISHSRKYSLLSVNPITGRSHQIRAHLASIGHPIVGDVKYRGKPVKAAFSPYPQRTLLHCRHLAIIGATNMNLLTGVAWEATLPEDFHYVLERYFPNYKRISTLKD